MGRSLVHCFDLLINKFEIEVPAGYENKSQLSKFFSSGIGKAEGFRLYEEKITDKNFSRVTHQLVSRKTYTVRVFDIKADVTSKECLILLTSQKAVLVGAQGLVLLWELCLDKLPQDKHIISFDKEDNLWKDAYGNYQVPYIRTGVVGGWMLNLSNFRSIWGRINCLVCFCEK